MFNYVSNIEHCSTIVGQMVNNSFSLLYYSHIPALIISLFLGLLIFFKNRKLLAGKIFLGICVSFSLWLVCNLVLWKSSDSQKIMFFWSIMAILDALFFILSFYFAYVFINKKDISFKLKMVLSIILLPIIILTPTTYNLSNFMLSDCEATESNVLLNYLFSVEILMILCVLFFSIFKYFKATREDKKQIVLLSFGIVIFILSFFIAGYLADRLDGIIFGSFKIEFYGLFGMPVFLGILAYLIVKFKVFNIKLIATQALIFALVILIASQFAFIRNNTNKILTAITLAIAVIFGWILVRSVKKEVKQREELEIANAEIEKRNEAIVERNEKLKVANKEITKRKNQLQKISDSLAIANDKLQKLDTAKTDFISMASHQLRTPPTPIKGYSSMLLEGSYGELNAEQKKAVENIYNANNQQITFVEDLLAVSRIESGSMKFVFAKCQIGDLCQEVVNNLILKAKANGLYLDYTAPNPPLPELAIDGNKIREVISNLVDNALKYTPRGGVTLLTELCEKKDQNCLKKPHLRITVSDTGIGIPAEEIPYLFHKFSRGKDISRLNTGGTGLGLYVAKIITEANGGNIWIESPGKDRGSKFIIELPLDQTQETLERNG